MPINQEKFASQVLFQIAQMRRELYHLQLEALKIQCSGNERMLDKIAEVLDSLTEKPVMDHFKEMCAYCDLKITPAESKAIKKFFRERSPWMHI